MNDPDALAAARRHIVDAIDIIDEVDSHSTASIVAVALLTGARICVDAQLGKRE